MVVRIVVVLVMMVVLGVVVPMESVGGLVTGHQAGRIGRK